MVYIIIERAPQHGDRERKSDRTHWAQILSPTLISVFLDKCFSFKLSMPSLAPSSCGACQYAVYRGGMLGAGCSLGGCVEARSLYQLPFSIAFQFTFETGSLSVNLELPVSARLSDQWAPDVHPCPPHPAPQCSACLWRLEIPTQGLCLSSRYCIPVIYLPSPESFLYSPCARYSVRCQGYRWEQRQLRSLDTWQQIPTVYVFFVRILPVRLL